MLRLIIALGVAGLLLPAETVTSDKITIETSSVSTYETFSAAHAVYSDVTSFCERNVETCVTGKALAYNAVNTVRTRITQLTQDIKQAETTSSLDQIKTGSIEK